MKYFVRQDLESALEITGYSTEKFAEELGISRITVNGWLNGQIEMSDTNMKDFYEYVFKAGIRLNKIKEQLYREDIITKDDVLLFHGAKTEIEGDLNFAHNKKINDFGNGFYCGESLEQSAMFVSNYPNSSLYMVKFKPENLKCREFDVSREWMLTIAYYRGRLDEYKESETVKNIIEKINGIDYIIAPIADNRMFEIIDNFIEGEITDEQCRHCLSATNLGKQYVFITQKALGNVTLLEKCYLAEAEKAAYLQSRLENFSVNMDKVKLARKQYRNQGQYIEDILK